MSHSLFEGKVRRTLGLRPRCESTPQHACADEHVDELTHRAIALQTKQARAEYTSKAFVSATRSLSAMTLRSVTQCDVQTNDMWA